jgi:GNAT superfamily N-acetyltransferase
VSALPGIQVRAVVALPDDVVRGLYQAAGWWQPGDREGDIGAMIRGSACFAAAFDGDRAVGMARVLSDGASDAYIQDVVVLPSHRRRGIGAALVAFLRDWCAGRGIGWVGLVAEPGTTEFYGRLGFDPMEGFVPMRLRRGQVEGP